jgi:histidine triad (HIT) family protein
MGGKGTVDDCIFCKIGRQELAARVVYQDDDVVAFHDISPQAPVHVLVIPREHYANFNDDVPPAVGAALCSAVPRVAQIAGIAESGYRVIVNNGPDSNQTVPHLHVHVMGGRPMTHGMVRFAE